MGTSADASTEMLLRRSSGFISAQQRNFLCFGAAYKRPTLTPQVTSTVRWVSHGGKATFPQEEVMKQMLEIRPLLQQLQKSIQDMEVAKKRTATQLHASKHHSDQDFLQKSVQDQNENAEKKFDNFVRSIAKNAKIHQSVDIEKLKILLNIYRDLHHLKNNNGITRVLSGVVDTPKSSIYNAINRYLQSQGSDLKTCRKDYKQLEKSLGKEPLNAAEEIIEVGYGKREALFRSLLESLESKSTDVDLVSVISEGSNPMYPTDPEEVKTIVNLYTSLEELGNSHGITRVLSGVVDTPKSSIYNSVARYLQSQGSDLKTCRKQFGWVSQALNNNALTLIEGFYFLGNTPTTSKMQQIVPGNNPTALKSEAIIRHVSHSADPPLEECFLNTRNGKYNISLKDKDRFNKFYELLLRKGYKQKSVTDALRKMTPVTTSINSSLGEVIDEIRKSGEVGCSRTIDLQYFRKLFWALEKERNNSRVFAFEPEHDVTGRLIRLYALLPEYSGKSITDALKKGDDGEVKTNIGPDLNAAISKIREEAISEGSTENIDIAYFRKLFSAAGKLRDTGNSE